MATLTTKFDMSQTVWYANTTTGQFQHKCPDCNDTRAWEATSPAGGVFSVPCPRCSVQYSAHDELRLAYTKFVPAVRSLTIGQIKASTEIGEGYDAGNSYMCLETGVGGGSVYRERDLFATEAEALVAAHAKADAANTDQGSWVARQYDKTARFSDYQFSEARSEAARDRARRYGVRVGYLFEELETAETLDEVRSSVERWRETPDEDLAELISDRAALFLATGEA